MAVVNLTALFNESAQQLAIVKESADVVVKAIRDWRQDWEGSIKKDSLFEFTAPNGKALWARLDLIAVVAEVQAEMANPNIAIARPMPGPDPFGRPN